MAKTVLKKDKTVNVKTKSGGSYSYSYSTLAEIHRYLEETGQKYEAFIKKVGGDDYMFIRKLSKNENIIVELQGAKIPPVTGVQDYGGVLTSVRRFSLLMAYGLACEDDDARPSGVEEAREKWKATHTASPNKPPSERQKAAISTLLARLGKDSVESLNILGSIKTSEQASAMIKQLGERVGKDE